MVKKQIFIVGTTASGKSNLSQKIYKNIKTKIINTDSIIIKKKKNIGSDKPNNKILKKIKHNLVNIINTNENFSIKKFIKKSNKVITKYNSKKITPMYVGGNLMYSLIIQKENAKNKIKNINLCLLPSTKKTLRENIIKRINLMINNKLIEEIINLHRDKKANLFYNKTNEGIGYKEFLKYINNKKKLIKTIIEIKKNTFELANKQILWIKKIKKNIFYINRHCKIKNIKKLL